MTSLQRVFHKLPLVSGRGIAILICVVNCHVAKKDFNGTTYIEIQLHLLHSGTAIIMQNMPA